MLLLLCLLNTELFSQMIPYRVGWKWGYSDTAGKLIVNPVYDLADFYEHGLAFVKKDSFFYGVNTKGEIITEPYMQYGKFSFGLCPVTNKRHQSYFIDSTGKNVFNKVFSAAENFSEGLSVVSMKNKCGIINTIGEWVREPDFDSSSLYFKSGFLLAKRHGKFVYIDRHGKELLLAENLRPAGIFSEGMAAVYCETKSIINNTIDVKTNLQFIDSSGNVVLSKFVSDGEDYTDYVNYQKEFIDGKAIVNVANQLAYDRYLMDKKGNFSHVYSYTQHLGDSMFLGVIGYMLPTVRIYNSSYDVMGDFSSILSSVGTFGNHLLAVQNRAGYWGYCDSNTKMIIPFIYESADAFNKGYAIVKKQGRFGVINSQGKEFFVEQ